MWLADLKDRDKSLREIADPTSPGSAPAPFSKKWENLKSALALHFAWYNFCRVHSSLRLTPAMEAGIADHIWNVSELISAN